MGRKWLIALALALALTGCGGTEQTPETAPPTEAASPQKVTAVIETDRLPVSCSPLEPAFTHQTLFLTLTGRPLYRLEPGTGHITPCLASAMPEDVTAEYAGSWGVPQTAVGGRAYRINLAEDAAWQNGEPINADTVIESLRQYLLSEVCPPRLLELAHARDYLEDVKKPGSLQTLEALGFDSVAAAEAAGYRDFYLDTDKFWGLDTGWVSIEDRTRLADEAIPSNVGEYYVSGAYLYRYYLGPEGEYSYLAPEFLAAREPGTEQYEFRDVGIVRAGEFAVDLIFREPVAALAAACTLSEIYPLGGSFDCCGPYRITGLSSEELRLERNPGWTQPLPADAPDTLVFRQKT